MIRLTTIVYLIDAKHSQFSPVHGNWTGLIIHEVIIYYLQEKKTFLVPENKLKSIKTAFDLELVVSL